MLTAYLVIALCATVLLIIRCSVFSYAFLAIIFFFLLSLLIFPLYHPLVIGLLGFVLLFPLCRLLYLILSEFKHISLSLGRRTFLIAIATTLMLWLPFPLLAIVGYGLLSYRDYQVYKSLDTLIYESYVDTLEYGCGSQFTLVCRCQRFRESPLEVNALASHDCPMVDQGFYRVQANAGDMQRDIHSAVERLKTVFRDHILSRIKKEIANSKGRIRQYNGNIEMALFGRQGSTKSWGVINNDSNNKPLIAYSLSDYHPDLQPPDCHGVIDQLFKLKDCVKNIALAPLSNTYLSIRERLRTETQDITRAGNQSVDTQLNVLISRVEIIINNELDRYSYNAHRSVETGFRTLNTLDHIAFLLWVTTVLYAVFIGFLYLFVRYVYNRHYGKVSFNIKSVVEEDALANNGTQAKADTAEKINVRDITVDDTMNSFSQPLLDEAWYAVMDSSLRYEVDGIITLPRPFTLLFKRLPGRYLMFRFARAEGKACINAYADGLTRFLKIQLQPGQSMCFEYDNLVAFSDGLHLQVTANLSLTAFFQNQLFFSTAEGPGEFILMTKSGKPEVMPRDGVKPSDPRDIIAFETVGDYSLLADLKPLSVYFLGHRVLPCDKTTVLRQSPDAQYSFSSQATAVRSALFLLLPLTFMTIILPLILH